MVRAPFFDKNGVKKGAWSQEEDDKLRASVQKYGHFNWRELPKFAGLSRCGKSCRLRWMNYLRPGVKHGSYSKEEDDLIFELHKQFGNKWSKIAAKLPGRTDNEIKNYWHTHLKKKTKEGASSSGFRKKLLSDVKLESSLAKNILSPSIFESFQFSPPSSSPTEFSHLTSDSASTSSNWIAEGSHPLSETFESYGGDFWTQPFLSEKDAHRLPLPQEGFVSSYFTNYYEDDAIDLFYQVTKELPGNFSQ